MNTFQTLGLNEELLRAIADLGFETPSEVQEKAIPVLLETDTDMVALAQTGTGKTAAFGFPLIQKINPKDRSTQALILSPTRELCLQITNEIKNYSKYVDGLHTVAVYGGASITEQAKQVKRGAQIIVATPGRMLDMIRRRYVDITGIQFCVLDEADEMLNMGFYEDITSILSDTPDEKTTWLFSATMPKEVAQIAKEFMSNPYEITVGHKNEGTKNVSHEFYIVGARDRYPVLKRLADMHPDIFSVVFCRTKRDTQSVAEKLIEDGYNAAALHGDLSQAQRDGVMKSFRGRQIQMLVATDVAARGIDVDDVTHVINYQLPDDVETYTHRSGRTGRAGKTGTSIVIITKSERRKIAQIERIMKTDFKEKSIPTGEEICEVQLFHLVNKVKEVKVDAEIEKYLPKIEEDLADLSKEELIRRMFSVEFNRFIEYYKKQNILKAPAKSEVSSNDDSVRYFLNLGARDDFDWMSLKDFLKASLNLGRDEVYKVDVKEGFSFFNTDAQHADRVMEILNNMQHEGRRVNVEISSSSSKGGGGRRGGKGDRGRRPRRNDNEGFNNQKFGRRRNNDKQDRPLKNERSKTRGNRPRRSN
ncbi:MAG TPA: DEAD/DEAH box helicase [Flavobacterium sp.]|nr:DEAD/DEAH box helicase [Flavobacterium sp.]